MQTKDLVGRIRILNNVAERNPSTSFRTSIWSAGPWLVSSNMEQTVMAKTGIHLDKPVYSAEFFTSLKDVAKDKAVVEVINDADRVTIKNSKGVRSSVMHAELDGDVPKPPTLVAKKTAKIKIDLGELKYVFQAVSREIIRYALTGVLFDGPRKRIVASDGRRLNIRPFWASAKMPRLNIPAKAVKTLIDAMALGLELKTISWNDEQAQFEFDGMVVTTRFVDGNWPDYEDLIPTHHHWTVSLNTKSLVTAVKSAIKALNQAKEKYFGVKFHMDKDHVDLVVRSENHGSKTWPIEVYEIRGDRRGFQWLNLNPTYLLESIFAEGTTFLQGSTTDKAVCIDGTSITMPLKPLTYGEEIKHLEEVTQAYKKLKKGEVMVEFPESPVSRDIPKAGMDLGESPYSRCDVCCVGTEKGITLCGPCSQAKSKSKKKAPRRVDPTKKAIVARRKPKPWVARRKPRLKDIKLDEQDLVDLIEDL